MAEAQLEPLAALDNAGTLLQSVSSSQKVEKISIASIISYPPSPSSVVRLLEYCLTASSSPANSTDSSETKIDDSSLAMKPTTLPAHFV